MLHYTTKGVVMLQEEADDTALEILLHVYRELVSTVYIDNIIIPGFKNVYVGRAFARYCRSFDMTVADLLLKISVLEAQYLHS